MTLYEQPAREVCGHIGDGTHPGGPDGVASLRIRRKKQFDLCAAACARTHHDGWVDANATSSSGFNPHNDHATTLRRCDAATLRVDVVVVVLEVVLEQDTHVFDLAHDNV